MKTWEWDKPSMRCKFCGTFYALDPRYPTIEIEMCEKCYRRALDLIPEDEREGRPYEGTTIICQFCGAALGPDSVRQA